MIAGIPEGAFRDRMQEILTDKTAIRWSLAPSLSPQMREGVEEMLEERVALLRGTPTKTTEAAAAIRPAQSSDAQRSVVRYAVSLLLQNPTFIESIGPPPYAFADLRRPGIALLIELLDFCRSRPSASTAALLQHYEEREDGVALRKLAVLPLHGDSGTLEREFIDALNVLGAQTAQQRADDLIAKQGERGLDEAEKIELRGLLAARRR
jgi:DNA primase